MTKAFVFAMIDDDNAAPHTKGGLTTFNICKPLLRRVAKTGDLIIGTYARDLAKLLKKKNPKSPIQAGDVLFVGLVAGRITMVEYDKTKRKDAIYQYNGDWAKQKRNPWHVASQTVSDTYGKFCIVFERYFRFTKKRVTLKQLNQRFYRPMRHHRTFELKSAEKERILSVSEKNKDRKLVHVGGTLVLARKQAVEADRKGKKYPYTLGPWVNLVTLAKR